MPAHIVLFEVIERVFVESLYEPENVREVNPSIIFINVTSLPLSSVSIKILYKNTFLADVDPYIIIETYVILLIPLILKENESVLVGSMYVLLFYQMIIAELFPEKVNITVFVFESTIPVTLSLLAPCKDSTTITSLYCLVTRSNVSDVVLIVPNTIAALYLCKSILIDFPYISFLFTLLFYSSFTIAFFMFS